MRVRDWIDRLPGCIEAEGARECLAAAHAVFLEAGGDDIGVDRFKKALFDCGYQVVPVSCGCYRLQLPGRPRSVVTADQQFAADNERKAELAELRRINGDDPGCERKAMRAERRGSHHQFGRGSRIESLVHPDSRRR